MCGIVGAITNKGARRMVLRGLSTLEYRGYDSAGMAFVDSFANKVQQSKKANSKKSKKDSHSKQTNKPHRVAVVGRVAQLKPLTGDGVVGIGHTRWATHGAPTINNAHPIAAGNVAVVHNGIIENHATLRNALRKAKRTFHSETDTEVIAHLLNNELQSGKSLAKAVCNTAGKLEGAFAIAAVTKNERAIMFMRRGAPLMLGRGEDGVYLASDAQALEGYAEQICYLEDGDCGVLLPQHATDNLTIMNINAKGKPASVTREWQPFPAGVSVTALGEHRHFMQKEIAEQPLTAAAAISPYINKEEVTLRAFGKFSKDVRQAFCQENGVLILACGTSYHAGLVAQHWFHRLGVPCRVAIASEYRYGNDPLVNKTLVIAVSQSGETADTLSAMRAAKKSGAPSIAIVNADKSAMAREADYMMNLNAGPEIGVASTKCFVSQLVQLLILSSAVAKARRTLSPENEKNIAIALRNLPHLIRRGLQMETDLQTWAHTFATAKSALFIGRRAYYPLALEGALKLKEISYIHAEGCAAGELKHGLLALVDEHMPIVGLLPNDEVAAKMESNLSEAAARGGKLFILYGEGNQNKSKKNKNSIQQTLPNANILHVEEDAAHAFWTSPMAFAPPLQLLAYHTALEKGTDIDKPRNLAKSVTVE